MASINISSGSLQEPLHQQFTDNAAGSVIDRIWKKDHTVWRSEEVHRQSILNRLGWLSSVELMQQNADMLIAFGQEIAQAGFRHVVVLGMGGSSLCPDVCRATFGSAPGYPQLLVLDSTNPTSVLRIERQLDLSKTLFVVASKSGGTTETNMFYQYFYGRVATMSSTPGQQFIAVTDADTKMEAIAREKGFRRIFINPTDIGGRYSALSYFGLVPMALIGMDIKRLLHSAEEMQKQCRFEIVQNPAAQIGLLMGEAHNEGMDKMTLVMSPEIATFGYWAEQLIAESTGKEGKGILPVEGERIDGGYDAGRLGSDRFLVFILLEKDLPAYAPLRKELTDRRIPFAVVTLKDIHELGSQFFLWEFATAVASVVLKINPFDEPNVKESKDNTVRVITEFRTTGALPVNPVIAQDEHITVHAETSSAAATGSASVNAILKNHCSGERGEDYLALLAYVDQSSENEAILASLRSEMTEIFGLPVTVGFGPRYLHSTGQLHKGGAANGIVVIITADEPADVPIPGEVFTFEVLKNAQALGDYRSFADRGRRLLHLHLRKNVPAGLEHLRQLFLH